MAVPAVNVGDIPIVQLSGSVCKIHVSKMQRAVLLSQLLQIRGVVPVLSAQHNSLYLHILHQAVWVTEVYYGKCCPSRNMRNVLRISIATVSCLNFSHKR